MPFSHWAARNKATIEIAHQLQRIGLIDVVPDLIKHREATRRFVERLRAAEQAPESALVRERFPGAELIDDLDGAEINTGQMELLDD